MIFVYPSVRDGLAYRPPQKDAALLGSLHLRMGNVEMDTEQSSSSSLFSKFVFTPDFTEQVREN